MTAQLRAATVEAIAAIRALARAGVTPPPANDARCEHCSLDSVCQPALLAEAHDPGDALYHLPPEEA